MTSSHAPGAWYIKQLPQVPHPTPQALTVSGSFLARAFRGALASPRQLVQLSVVQVMGLDEVHAALRVLELLDASQEVIDQVDSWGTGRAGHNLARAR